MFTCVFSNFLVNILSCFKSFEENLHVIKIIIFKNNNAMLLMNDDVANQV